MLFSMGWLFCCSLLPVHNLKQVQTGWNPSKYIQTSSDWFKPVSTCSNLFELVWTHPNPSEPVRTRPNPSELIRIRLNSSEPVWTRRFAFLPRIGLKVCLDRAEGSLRASARKLAGVSPQVGPAQREKFWMGSDGFGRVQTGSDKFGRVRTSLNISLSILYTPPRWPDCPCFW